MSKRYKIVFPVLVIVLCCGFTVDLGATPENSEEPGLAGIDLPSYIPLVDFYVSGLTTITAGTSHTFTHDLGGDPGTYLVYLYGHNDHGYHQANYGTNPFYVFPSYRWMGVEWQQLNDKTITVVRAPDDDINAVGEVVRWDQVSVVILRLGPSPRGISYAGYYTPPSSISLDPGDKVTLYHGLGGDPRYYLVYVYGCAGQEYHQANYGTNPALLLPSEKWIGLEWKELNDTTITLHRAPDDTLTYTAAEKLWDRVNVLIIKWNPFSSSPPYVPLRDYVADDVSLPISDPEVTYGHGLGGDPGTYLVHIYGKYNDSYHQANYGTNPFDFPWWKWMGFEWQEMNSSTIKLIRAPQDNHALVPPEKQWNVARVIMIRPI